MSGVFPDVTRFKSVTVRSDATQLSTVDQSNNLYSVFTDSQPTSTMKVSGLSQHFEFDFTTVPLSRAEMAPMYSFLCAQNGTAETFTIKPPGTAHRYLFDTASDRPFIFGTSMTKGEVGIIFSLESSTNSQDHSEDGGITILNYGDFIKFHNHDKVYMNMAQFSVPCANFVDSLVTQNGYLWPPLQKDVPSGIYFNWDPTFTVAMTNEPQVIKSDIDGLYELSFSVREEY